MFKSMGGNIPGGSFPGTQETTIKTVLQFRGPFVNPY